MVYKDGSALEEALAVRALTYGHGVFGTNSEIFGIRLTTESFTSGAPCSFSSGVKFLFLKSRITLYERSSGRSSAVFLKFLFRHLRRALLIWPACEILQNGLTRVSEVVSSNLRAVTQKDLPQTFEP
jgi:hypothetical protein